MELKQFFKKSRKFYLLALLLLIFTVPVALSGCGGGGGGSSSSSSPTSATYTVTPTGGPAITGATVTMYDLNNNSNPTTCQQTSTSGQYTCTISPAPSNTDALYITVSGGSAGGNAVLTNLITPTIINNKGYNNIPVNELTTVAATDALKQADFTNVSTGNAPAPPTTNASTAITNAVQNITNIADSVHFTSGKLTSTAQSSQNSEQIESLINVLDTLANALSTCVNTPSSCSTLLSYGGSPSTGTTLNVVVNVYSNTASSGTTLSLTGLTTIADTGSGFNSGTTLTPVIAPLTNTGIPTTSTSNSSPASSISSAVMYQYATTGSSPYVINEYPIDPTTGVVTSSTPQTVTTGPGVLGVAFNENNSYAYAIDGNDNIWVYSANNGILTYSKEYSLSQYLTSANYSALPSGYSDNNGFIQTVLNTLYVILPSTQYGETLVAIPINSDGSLGVSSEIAIQDYQGNYHQYNFNSSTKFFNNVVLEVYNTTAGAYELNAYSLNSSGMISSATPISTISFSTTGYSTATVTSGNITESAPLVTYIPYMPNSGFYFAYTFGSNTGGAGIYNITFNQNGVLTDKQGSIDTANGSTSLFNNVAVPNANYLYYTDNTGNIYVCDNSSSTPINCSEAKSTSSFLPSGYSVNNGQESLFFIGNTLYANATLTSTSGYTNYLFPFTINSNNGSLNLDSGNEIIGGTGTSATSYFGSIYTFYPYNYIFSSSVTANGNTIEAYSVDPSTGLVDVSNPVSSTGVENAGDSYLGDGDIIKLDYSNSVGTLNNYLENNGSFNLDGSMALNGIEMLDGALNFPFTALSQVNPDENYMTSVYCNEFENVCNNEPPIAAYIDGYAGIANARSIYGIQIGTNALTAMNSGNVIASYMTGNTYGAINYAVEIYEFFPSGYPSAEENGIASELNAYSF